MFKFETVCVFSVRGDLGLVPERDGLLQVAVGVTVLLRYGEDALGARLEYHFRLPRHIVPLPVVVVRQTIVISCLME